MSVEQDILKLLVAHKNYLRTFTNEREITEDNKALRKYIKDICTGSCNLTYKMEPDKCLIVTQDQLVCTLIVDLYVAPEYRRQGIATKLISEIEGPIKLECFDKNPAKNLYLKLGFEPQDWRTAKNCHWYLKNVVK